jgi:hypothetical protein
MVGTLPIPKQLITDAWVACNLGRVLVASEDSEQTKARCYYDFEVDED